MNTARWNSKWNQNGEEKDFERSWDRSADLQEFVMSSPGFHRVVPKRETERQLYGGKSLDDVRSQRSDWAPCLET